MADSEYPKSLDGIMDAAIIALSGHDETRQREIERRAVELRRLCIDSLRSEDSQCPRN